MKSITLLVGLFIILKNSSADDYIINNKKFPDDFYFGVATSSYQIEGGWNADGKGESYWDSYTHQTPSPISDGSNGDIACDSYNKYETDVEMLKYLGVTHYRFSISWPRILPTGYADQINEPGVQYYKKLIKLLIDNNIVPLVTLYHWDIPLTLYNLGGLYNETFIDWFADYARVVFKEFGNDVTHWSTFNEAIVVCNYMGDTKRKYICGHNLLRAHAAAWHVYDKEFRAQQKGVISMVHNTGWNGAATDSAEDRAASERAMQFELGWWANPTYKGDYPEVMKERLGDRLPKFTDDEKAALNGTSDFFSFNTYSSNLVKDDPNGTNPFSDAGIAQVPNTEYPNGAWGIQPLALWIQSHYNDPYIIITENGLGVDVNKDTLEDNDRITYVQDYLSGIRDAIDSGVKLIGYTLWSVMDNFEWNSGYSRRFGIYHVNFTDANRTRTPKKSAEWYKKVISTRCLVDECV